MVAVEITNVEPENVTVTPVNRPAWLDGFAAFINFSISYVMVVTLLFGTAGNCFSIAIFWKRRNQDRVSASYLGPLAVFDLWNCAIGWYHWCVQGLNGFTQGLLNYQHYATTDLGCFAVVFCNVVAMCLSAWTIVIFTVERALVINFPLKIGPKLTTGKRRNALIIMTIIILSLNCISVIVEPYDVLGKNLCNAKSEYGPVVFWLFFFIINGLYAPIPCTLLLVFNIWIAVGVLKSKKMEKSAKNTTEDRALRNLIAVSTCYFIFALPWSIFMGLGFTDFGKTSEVIGRLTSFSIAWANINFCINPILYVWSLPYYRTAISRVFCGCCTKSELNTGSKFETTTSSSAKP